MVELLPVALMQARFDEKVEELMAAEARAEAAEKRFEETRSRIELDHLSYSSISSWLMCPRAWRYYRVDKVPAKTGPALVFGSAFHNAVEDRIRHNVNNRAVPMAVCWSEAWVQQLERNKDNIDWGDSGESEMNSLATRMLATPMIRNVIDTIQPLMVRPNTWETKSLLYDDSDLRPVIEQLVELNIENCLPLIGYVDVVTSDGVPADLKTSSRKWNQKRADEQMQCTLYIAAMEAMGYEGNPSREFRYFVFTKTSKPIAQVLTTSRSQKEIDWALQAVRDTYDAIKTGVYPPGDTSSWKCTPKWCSFYEHCGRGE